MAKGDLLQVKLSGGCSLEFIRSKGRITVVIAERGVVSRRTAVRVSPEESDIIGRFLLGLQAKKEGEPLPETSNSPVTEAPTPTD